MEITLAELNIIVDTLLGSRSISDGGTFWKYTKEAREAVAEKLLREMSKVNLDIKVKG